MLLASRYSFLKKQVRSPVWHTLPLPRRFTFSSTVSSSQSTRMLLTASLFPDVSPFVQSFCRDRLKNVAYPVSTRSGQRLFVHEAHHQHFAAFVVLNDRGHQPVQLCEIHVAPPETKNPAGRWRGSRCSVCEMESTYPELR